MDIDKHILTIIRHISGTLNKLEVNNRNPHKIIENKQEYVTDEQITEGLKELLEDTASMRMMNIIPEEIKSLKSVRFLSHQKPTKQTYINILFEIRKSGEE